MYEIFSTTFYALTPNDSEEVELQKILWSPASYDSSNLVNNNNNNNNRQKKVLPSSKTKVKTFEKSKISQAIAFIHDYDIYYKPKIHSDLVIRVTTNGEYQYDFLLSFLSEVVREQLWSISEAGKTLFWKKKFCLQFVNSIASGCQKQQKLYCYPT